VQEIRPRLSIENLTVAYRSNRRWNHAIQDVTLQVLAGQTYGLVGESGSGKTTLSLAVMRHLPANGAATSGKILLDGKDICVMTESEMRQIWGRELALVPQDPLSALNPSIRIGEQLSEVLRHHMALTRGESGARVLELLEMVHLADPGRVARSYPHQLSGGMQQRVMIAMALSTEPKLLILDEPTTSLDVTTQAVILDLLRELIKDRNTAVLYVTHNLGVVASICDRVAVLYAGELVEDAPASQLFHKPRHPYTQGLLNCVPRLGETKGAVRIDGIEGDIPPLGRRPEGCVFADRCPLKIDVCATRPPLYDSGPDRTSRCHRWEEVAGPDREARAVSPVTAASDQTDESVLRVDELVVHFPVRRSVREILSRKPAKRVRAVNGMNLSINRNRTLGLVGESGSGKTTISRAIMGLEKPSAGVLDVLGVELPRGLSKRSKDQLRHLQMVFQNPEDALNPYMRIGESLERPLISLLNKSRSEARAEAVRLLEAVRLPASYIDRLPTQLSGGEKQRVAIARAFASEPDLLICDEPVSSLDVSVQASILNLLNGLREKNRNSLLFISHDIAVVGYVADWIAVIYRGRLMEVAYSADLFEPPYHPYTESLLSAVPLADPDARQDQIRLTGEIPSPVQEITGCPFHTRCPRYLGAVCDEETPPWQTDENADSIFCHIPIAELKAAQKRPFAFDQRVDS
jgi:peptide/nickel transport system ATP-binding protein